MDCAWRTLLTAASWAPSGDNTQPWRWLVDADAQLLILQVDETRDPSPMNAGQRMARIGAGAALENLERTARRLGIEMIHEEAIPPALAVLRIPKLPGEVDRPDIALLSRATNRRFYIGRRVSPDLLSALRLSTPPLSNTTTHWIIDSQRRATLATIVGRADALMFTEPSMRRAFLANVRFDAPAMAAVEEGLSQGSLELSAFERKTLPYLAHWPTWLFRWSGVARSFAARARRLVGSASGLCLVVAQDGSPETDLHVGRALQRAWLTLTERGLVAQPMMAPLVLENVLDHGAPALIAALDPARLEALRRDLRSALPEATAGRPAFLLRFGWAPPATSRTGRRPVEASVSFISRSNHAVATPL